MCVCVVRCVCEMSVCWNTKPSHRNEIYAGVPPHYLLLCVPDSAQLARYLFI